MRERCGSVGIAAGVAAALALAGPAEVSGQEQRGPLEIRAAAFDDTRALRRFDALVETLAAGGELALASSRPDPQLPGRTQQFFQQYHEGVPVYGAGVSRQQAGGATVSLLGMVETGIALDPRPRFQSAEALRLLEQHTGAGALTNELPELVIRQVPSGRHVLAYRAPMRDLRTYYLDAHTGRIAHAEDLVREQAVGAGNGILDQRKKLSTSQAGGVFQAYDRLRPAEIITLDLRYDVERFLGLLIREVTWASSDVASDADNEWSDPAVVDGHAYLGFTYDYLEARQGWSGVDGMNGRIFSLVNVERGFDNAFYASPPVGPEGLGVFAFGEAEDGPPIVSADVVAHEAMHGVTFHSVAQRTGMPLLDSYWSILGPSSFTLEEPPRFALQAGVHECGQVYTWDRRIMRPAGIPPGARFRFACRDGRFELIANEGGAVNEAWSDMFGTAVEFMVHEPAQGPLRADYEMGEDSPPAFRSLERPRSITLAGGTVPYPDAAGNMVRFLLGLFEDYDQAFFSPFASVDGENIIFLGSLNYDGVHWNSTVLSHAYYLAIEGGTHETSGLTVRGVGADRRHDIERVFFRAMTELMPPVANVGIAAQAVRAAAVDLFGPGGDVFAAVHQALNAVGLRTAESDG